jgi:MFS family permease
MKEEVKLGLTENWRQFALLVLVNAFVGGMVGTERSIFPQFAETQFGIGSKSAMLAFITAFGISKAIANYYTGRLAERYGRRNLLLFGWVIAFPVPILLIFAPNWETVIFANILLGISQGLTWSSTVVMKIDLVGPKNRGLAMGLNEFAGYLSVGIFAYLTAHIAEKYGVTPYPFYTGIFLALAGFLLTAIWVKDTRVFAEKESQSQHVEKAKSVFWETTLLNRNLSSVTQAGLVNNLNDGMIWGLLPALLFSLHYDYHQTGIVASVYPAFWGIGQLFTGKMSDHFSKKKMLFWGMFLQGIALLIMAYVQDFAFILTLSALLGIGTALVYPTFLTAIAETSNPKQRAESVGTFRLWRDLGYAFGAVISGLTADFFGLPPAIVLTGALTILSALVIIFRMQEKMASA